MLGVRLRASSRVSKNWWVLFRKVNLTLFRQSRLHLQAPAHLPKRRRVAGRVPVEVPMVRVTDAVAPTSSVACTSMLTLLLESGVPLIVKEFVTGDTGLKLMPLGTV